MKAPWSVIREAGRDDVITGLGPERLVLMTSSWRSEVFHGLLTARPKGRCNTLLTSLTDILSCFLASEDYM
jgi:hypothetical protein